MFRIIPENRWPWFLVMSTCDQNMSNLLQVFWLCSGEAQITTLSSKIENTLFILLQKLNKLIRKVLKDWKISLTARFINDKTESISSKIFNNNHSDSLKSASQNFSQQLISNTNLTKINFIAFLRRSCNSINKKYFLKKKLHYFKFYHLAHKFSVKT